MITQKTCSVCGRILALATDDAGRGKQYCPDRPCILYPALSTSRAADPTISAWCLAIETMTDVPRTTVGLAMGHKHMWLKSVSTQQRKRWTAPR